MNAPTIWILVPAAIAVILLFIQNQRRLSILGGTLAVTLTLIAQFVPFETAMQIGPLALKIDSTLTILGRVLSSSPPKDPCSP